ncbi:(deoxy)nucleoside triphosphate pyrophosphohydrolase [Acuticoccus sp. MNP-M23]|uniref:(deoxy)nucleoside triphosphate pyrophosphohydrolase n=1 Tax=Acuticoccus sp. MNP-M23 TaxID=3072793 RepID=UPI002815AB97|nr:(deoxy)nucleoside triphosphate pyrophosphohydrolase [Acuticoccus sp. MNP-M23]WMS44984.1 (deoxy)nucleoside triphosphate pyrophosphohydrolase [Acuticoccus sp. MNP-M23]
MSEASARRVLTVVAAALMDDDGLIMLTQRPEGKAMAGLWEFPGGKLEPGESPEAALVRELAEELGIVVREADLKPFFFASHGYDAFHLLMPLYICKRWDGVPTSREGQAIRMVRPQEMDGYDVPAADVPLVRHIQTVFNR